MPDMDSSAARSSKAKGSYLVRVRANTAICREHWRLVLGLRRFPEAQPGQFLQILCRDPKDTTWGGSTFLRRPFSIAGIRRASQGVEIDIIHRVIGRGTRWLGHLQPGDEVSILGPQGRPFAIHRDRKVAYLVGGGVGLPPVLWLAEAVQRAGLRAVAFCGARTADSLPLTIQAKTEVGVDLPTMAIDEFARTGTPAIVCTDDGSLGTRGLIPDEFERYVRKHRDEATAAAVYTCGPEAMMRAVAEACERYNMPCQVCMERMMACGMGTCQSCVVPVRDSTDPEGWRYRLCCTDGPVFDSRQIIWDRSGGPAKGGQSRRK